MKKARKALKAETRRGSFVEIELNGKPVQGFMLDYKSKNIETLRQEIRNQHGNQVAFLTIRFTPGMAPKAMAQHQLAGVALNNEG